MNTIIYYGRILPSIFYCLKLSHLSVAFSCCINAVVDCANFLVKLPQYFFLRKSFVYNFWAYIVCIRKCICTFWKILVAYDDVLMKLKAHLLRKRDTTHK